MLASFFDKAYWEVNEATHISNMTLAAFCSFERDAHAKPSTRPFLVVGSVGFFR